MNEEARMNKGLIEVFLLELQSETGF